jgi:septal ring factor EnvC (AmiA/AmiB activator)
MARPGVTRKQVFEAAEALVREGKHPTILAVRTHLGGGSPNTIAPLLSEWRQQHEATPSEALPAIPETVLADLKRVWGATWQAAQAELRAEREALAQARQETERERAEMLSEIERLDEQLDRFQAEQQKMLEALNTERQAHEQTRSQLSETRIRAEERTQRVEHLESTLEKARSERDHTRQP